jgi:hypothetical protein
MKAQTLRYEGFYGLLQQLDELAQYNLCLVRMNRIRWSRVEFEAVDEYRIYLWTCES